MLNSINTQPQSSGGKIMAIRQRLNAEKLYFENPNKCLYCHKDILVLENQKVSQVRRKKFCNSFCSASFNGNKRKTTQKLCMSCGKPVRRSTKRCQNCYVKDSLKEFNSQTKGQLFSKCSNWQSARSTIQRNARTSYGLSNKLKKCETCGYDKHFEVCHIKAVSDFPDTALISEINHINNLKALCPNHHWEFDNLT